VQAEQGVLFFGGGEAGLSRQADQGEGVARTRRAPGPNGCHTLLEPGYQS